MEIMGIVNVTPDSFSDGGRWASADAAIAHGLELIEQGATIVDVGGESTRPGAEILGADTEWERIEPVVTELAKHATVSVDTYHADTARRAASAGAHIINDVTGGNGDPDMLATVAKLDGQYILQHGRGNAQTMNAQATYEGDLVWAVRRELLESRDRAVAAGIAPERIILDPGLGFAKLGDQDWEILARIDEFLDLGHPVLVGHSRKRFLGATVPGEHAPQERDSATGVVSAYLATTGVWATRVHNVQASISAIAASTKLDQHRKAAQ